MCRDAEEHAGCPGIFLNCVPELAEQVTAALQEVPDGLPADVYDLCANEFLGMVNPPRAFLREGPNGLELLSTDEIRRMLMPESLPDLIAMLRECMTMSPDGVVERDIVYNLGEFGRHIGHHVCRVLQMGAAGRPRLILDQIQSRRFEEAPSAPCNPARHNAYTDLSVPPQSS